MLSPAMILRPIAEAPLALRTLDDEARDRVRHAEDDALLAAFGHGEQAREMGLRLLMLTVGMLRQSHWRTALSGGNGV